MIMPPLGGKNAFLAKRGISYFLFRQKVGKKLLAYSETKIEFGYNGGCRAATTQAVPILKSQMSELAHSCGLIRQPPTKFICFLECRKNKFARRPEKPTAGRYTPSQNALMDPAYPYEPPIYALIIAPKILPISSFSSSIFWSRF